MTQEDSTQPETQQQRWLKYGSNVVLACVIVIALAVLLVYLGEKKSKRFDTTAAGLYSLKPQTLSLIKENKQPITIISLYSKAKPPQNEQDTSSDETDSNLAADQAGVVADLLEEYRSRGSNIQTEFIDPKLNPTKADDLINDVREQYGGEIKKYEGFINAVPSKFDSITKLANAELAAIKKLPLDQIQSNDAGQSVLYAVITVQGIPDKMKQGQDQYSHFLKQKPPDYKGITDSVAATMQGLSELTAKVIAGFNTSKERQSRTSTHPPVHGR